MTTPPDDASITGDDLLYRRVHHTMVVPDGSGGERPSSATFRPNDKDDDGLSGYLGSAIAQIPAVPADCLPPGSGYTLAAIGVQEIRDRGHGVLRDPVTDAEKPNRCDPAHALITGFASGQARDKQARALARQARWPA